MHIFSDDIFFPYFLIVYAILCAINKSLELEFSPLHRLDCVTPSYIPVRPFESNGPSNGVLLEVEEFVPCIAKCSQPFTTYINHLYVYPKHLKYDNQKSFAKVQ